MNKTSLGKSFKFRWEEIENKRVNNYKIMSEDYQCCKENKRGGSRLKIEGWDQGRWSRKASFSVEVTFVIGMLYSYKEDLRGECPKQVGYIDNGLDLGGFK